MQYVIVVVSYFVFICTLPRFMLSKSVEGFVLCAILLATSLLLAALFSRKVVYKGRILTNIGRQVLAVSIITVLLALAQYSIRDASPFIMMIYASWIVLVANLVFVAIFKLLGKRVAIVIIAVLILVVVGVPYMQLLPHTTEWSKTTSFENSLERQFAYRYNDNVYYTSNKREGIYKLTKLGEITKIVESVKIYNPHIYTLRGVENIIYFEATKKHWKSINLDSDTVKDEQEYLGEYEVCDYAQDAFIGTEKVLKKIGYIRDTQISDDGYIYFSTISTQVGIKNGIYRTRSGSDEYELVIEGDQISMFDASSHVLTYYCIANTPPLTKVLLTK